jgi:hypothetical protein
MSKFVCKRCNHETIYKQTIIKHVDRKYKCTNLNNIELNDTEEKYITIHKELNKNCKFCKKEFYNSSNRRKHERTCIIGKMIETNSSINTQNINTQNNNNSINNNSINNINSNNNIHIHINSYKDPSIEEHLEDKIRKYLISLKNTPIDSFIKRCFPGVFNMIYFDEDIPENHSIAMYEKKLIIYDGKKLIISDFDNIRASLESVLGFHIDRISSEVPEIDKKFEEYHNNRETSEYTKNRYRANYISYRDQEEEVIKDYIDKNSHISIDTIKKKYNSL